jgi:hypothetical protein
MVDRCSNKFICVYWKELRIAIHANEIRFEQDPFSDFHGPPFADGFNEM